jgi:hypothetical protein
MPLTQPAQQPTKPCQLQVNNSGAWKTVVRFDAASPDEVEGVEHGAEMLHNVNQDSRFRIATDDGLQTALMYLEKGEWRKV